MDAEALRRLADGGSLSSLPDGSRGVRVSLQLQSGAEQGSRQERKDKLHARFTNVAKQLEPKGASVDLASMSTLGQSVEAVLPVDTYEDLVTELESQHSVRVDPIIARDVARDS